MTHVLQYIYSAPASDTLCAKHSRYLKPLILSGLCIMFASPSPTYLKHFALALEVSTTHAVRLEVNLCR